MRSQFPFVQSSYDAGVKLLSERKFEAAMLKFRDAVAEHPDHAEAHFQIGRLFLEAFEARDAIKTFQKVAVLKPKSVKVWYGLAEAVALGGDQEDFNAFLDKVASAPIDTNTRIQLQDRFGAKSKGSRPDTGGVKKSSFEPLLHLVRQKKFVEAERSAKRLLTRHPRSALLYNFVAGVQADLGHDEHARNSYFAAIRIDPNYAEAYANFGRFLLNRNRLREAAEQLRRAVILTPKFAPAVASLGATLNLSGKPSAAIVLLERAHKLTPQDPFVLVELGNAFVRLSLSEKALWAYENGANLLGGKINLGHRVSLAQMQSRAGRDAEAMENVELALAERPDFPVAVTAKATMLQAMGRFDEARAYFEKSMKLQPTNGEIYRLYLSSHKAKEDEKIVLEMRRLIENEELSDIDRMNFGFALSKAMQDLGNDREVFDFLNFANGLMRKSFPYHIKLRRNEVARFQGAYEKYDYAGASGVSDNKIAPVFVTGLPRSGTTLVEQIIASHSTIQSGGELGKASELCSRLIGDGENTRQLSDLASTEFRNLAAEYSEYIVKRFPDANRITDKAITTYMHIGPLKLAMPNAKFIVVRRDPRDNLLSIYKNKFPEGTHPYAYDMEDLARYYTTFVDMIDFWRQRVPDWFYEVQYEELVANPEEESRKLIAACGLEWEDACLNFYENKNKVQTLSLYQVRQPISKASVKGWKRFEKDLEPMLKILREDGHVTD